MAEIKLFLEKVVANKKVWLKFLKKVVAMAQILKKGWSLRLKLVLKKVVAMAKIRKKGGRYG